MAMASACLLLYGCATSSTDRVGRETIADICASAIRARLAKQPLPSRQELQIFLYDRTGAALAARFPEYRISVHFRLTELSSPPSARWYAVRLLRVTQDTAVVEVDDAETLHRVLELRKRNDGQWLVVVDEMPLT